MVRVAKWKKERARMLHQAKALTRERRAQGATTDQLPIAIPEDPAPGEVTTPSSSKSTGPDSTPSRPLPTFGDRHQNTIVNASAMVDAVEAIARHAQDCHLPTFRRYRPAGTGVIAELFCHKCGHNFVLGNDVASDNLNKQVVHASLTTGSGYAGMKEQLAGMDSRFMSFNRYASYEATIAKPNPEKSETRSGGWSGAGDSTPPSKGRRRHSGSPHPSPAAPVPFSAPVPAPAPDPVPWASVSAPVRAPVAAPMTARESDLERSVLSESPRRRPNFSTTHSPPPPPPPPPPPLSAMPSAESHLPPPPPSVLSTEIKLEPIEVKEEKVDVGDCDTPLADPLGDYAANGVGLSGQFPEEKPGFSLAALSQATFWDPTGRGPVFRGLVTQRGHDDGGFWPAQAIVKTETDADVPAATAVKMTKAEAKKAKKAKLKAARSMVAKARAATRKKARPPATHPPTFEMVQVAIWVLKARNGSSLIAIKKFIVANYIVNMQTLAPFVKRALKSGVASGTLVQFRGKGASGSFKLAPAALKSAKWIVKAHDKMPTTVKPKQQRVQRKQPYGIQWDPRSKLFRIKHAASAPKSRAGASDATAPAVATAAPAPDPERRRILSFEQHLSPAGPVSAPETTVCSGMTVDRST